jgi:hypothetical protein
MIAAIYARKSTDQNVAEEAQPKGGKPITPPCSRYSPAPATYGRRGRG